MQSFRFLQADTGYTTYHVYPEEAYYNQDFIYIPYLLAYFIFGTAHFFFFVFFFFFFFFFFAY
jgi:hypothetical protein